MDANRLESQPGPVSGPAINGQQLPTPLVLFAEIFRYATADLCQSTSHHLAKIPLLDSHQNLSY